MDVCESIEDNRALDCNRHTFLRCFKMVQRFLKSTKEGKLHRQVTPVRSPGENLWRRLTVTDTLRGQTIGINHSRVLPGRIRWDRKCDGALVHRQFTKPGVGQARLVGGNGLQA